MSLVYAFSPALLAITPTTLSLWTIATVAINVLLVLGIVVYIRSITRRVNRRLDESVQEIAADQPFVALPDDGQMITIYAKKTQIIVFMIQIMVTATVFTTLAVWFVPQQVAIIAVIALLDVFSSVFVLFAIARLISRAPVLIVNAEGITDNATLIATGMGIVPWREVIGLSNNDPLQRVPLRISWPTTLNVITERQTVLQRQALWKRAILTFTATPLGPVCIPGFLLPMTVEELHMQIDEYLRMHGHTLPLSQVPAGADTPASAD